MGCINTPAIVTIQNAAAVNVRGVATSTNSFMSALGQTVAVAVFGMLLNRAVTDNTPSQLADGMHLIFVLILSLAVVTLFVVYLLPSEKKARAIEAA
jgi:branched-subunit amino acid transport protein AzlD